MKKVKDFMSKKVIVVKPNDTVFNVAKLFVNKGISGAPVVERNRVVGIISESDIVKFMELKFPHGELLGGSEPHILSLLLLYLLKDEVEFSREIKRISHVKVRDAMEKDIVFIEPEDSLFDAASLMDKHDINRLPVIKNNKLIGIITRTDAIKALI